ncbi:Endonuclease/exonuclease/phosphatase [Syntrophobacter sp. SbD1]|nr:Endonuclease/exonuclease/phosphatase [Syntrophobacter sp. SbD1]
MRRENSSCGQGAACGGFSVASYNIHKYVGIDGIFDPERVARVIKELKAEIIGLQEIDSLFYNEENRADLISEKSGLEMVLGPTKRNRRGHFGNALLTSCPVKEVRRIDLSVFGRQPRGALDVDLLVKGETIRVIVAHLGLGLRERRKQIRRLLDIFCSERDKMEIMLGDFNEWVPLGNPLCRVHNFFGKPPTLRTFPSFMPFLPLDRIWVRPFESLVCVSTHKSRLSRVASDHLPVKAVVVTENGRLQAEDEGRKRQCC